MNYYQILELTPSATLDEIKKSHRRLARLYHPDTTGVRNLDKSFRDIQEAYEVLSDSKSRERYDTKHGFKDWTKEKIETYKKNQQQTSSFAKKPHKKRARKNSSFDLLREHGLGNVELKSQQMFDSKEGTSQKLSGSKIFKHNNDENDSVRYSPSFIEKLKDGMISAFRKDLSGQKTNRPRTATESHLEKHLEEVRRKMREEHAAQESARRKPKGQEKIFRFTIDAMESLNGTSRELVLEEKGNQRRVRVKIPPGVSNEAILKINCPKTAQFSAQIVRVSVHIEAHSFVERDGLDVIVTIPITIGEALGGGEIQVPTMNGPVKVKIPAGLGENKRLRVKGRGVSEANKTVCGDLYVKTRTVLPEKADKTAIEAAKSIDRCYLKDVRENLPSSLKR